MNLLLKISKVFIPAFLKKRELMYLFDITAEAFACAAPNLNGQSFNDSLAMYAQFTRTAAEQSIMRGDSQRIIQERLFQGAFQLGEKYKRRFQIKTINEAMEAGRILYHILGIEFNGDSEGVITIRSCFFSKYYSALTCSMVSSLDAGLMAGLSGGSTLKFFRRITEGHDYCSAQLLAKEYSK